MAKTRGRNSTIVNDNYKFLLSILARHLQYLESVKADPELLKVFDHVLRYLNATPYRNMLEGQIGYQYWAPHYKTPDNSILDQNISQLSLEEVQRIIKDERSTRRYLEEIGIFRFGMTKSDVSKTKNKRILIDRLKSIIDNEMTHESIGRQASKITDRVIEDQIDVQNDQIDENQKVPSNESGYFDSDEK